MLGGLRKIGSAVTAMAGGGGAEGAVAAVAVPEGCRVSTGGAGARYGDSGGSWGGQAVGQEDWGAA
jgi:hypothetical protein